MQQRSPEWFEARKGRIAASTVGAILGLSPYMDRHDVMRAMVRETLGAEREFKGNIATEYGTNNEAGAMIDYRLETMHEVEEVGFVPVDDWAGVSPDGLIGTKGGLEIKCPYSLRDAPAPVPFKPLEEYPHYGAQVQFTLWATGREWWHFFQWARNGTKLEVVYPDAEWQRDNIPRLRQFHAEYLDEVAAGGADHLAPKRAIIDTPEAHKMVQEWDDISEQFDRLAERKKDLLDSIVSMAGDKNALFAGRKLTMTERQGSVAYARVVAEHCKGIDLEPYRGKPSRFWGLR